MASGAATAVRAAFSGATKCGRTSFRDCSARYTGGDGGGSATCHTRPSLPAFVYLTH